MSRWTEIAQIVLAGALTGFLIGPDSLEQFVGVSYDNPALLNVVVGAVAGLVLGFLATLSKPQAE